MTDEFRSYQVMDDLLLQDMIDHPRRYADGLLHTNTAEDFWSRLKRAWYGSPPYRRQFMPRFVAEAGWKYHHRKENQAFDSFLAGVFA